MGSLKISCHNWCDQGTPKIIGMRFGLELDKSSKLISRKYEQSTSFRSPVLEAAWNVSTF